MKPKFNDGPCGVFLDRFERLQGGSRRKPVRDCLIAGIFFLATCCHDYGKRLHRYVSSSSLSLPHRSSRWEHQPGEEVKVGHRHRRSGWLAVWTISLSDNILLSASCRSAGSELKLWGREARESPLGRQLLLSSPLSSSFPHSNLRLKTTKVPIIPHFISFSSLFAEWISVFFLLLCNQIQYLVVFLHFLVCTYLKLTFSLHRLSFVECLQEPIDRSEK